MSNIERVENLKQIVKKVQPDFESLARIHNAVNYTKEASFALQILNDNSYLAEIAVNDQDSFKRAIINVAAVGLSLNPLEKLAYLIPRKKKVCLDISYIGMIKLATDSGAIKWAAAEIVRANDTYEFQGVNREPIHKFHPFKDRGEIVGGYCLAKTFDGEFILSQMTGEEILSIRDRSESFKAGKSSPWDTDTNEMIKKTLIRRAYKMWPRTDTRDRLDKAIDVSFEADPVLLVAPAAPDTNTKEQSEIKEMRDLLTKINRTEENFIAHLCRVNNREIKKLEDLTQLETSQAIIMLNHFVEIKNQKEIQKGIMNEKAK
jgi:recombination protein RecT